MLTTSNEIRFETTTKCNFNCIICNNDKMTREKETMSLENFKFLIDKILDNTKQFICVSFAGIGEPLIDETLEDKVKYISDKGLKTSIVTNASLLDNDRLSKLRDSGLNILRISLHGSTPGNFAKLTGTSKSMYMNVKFNVDNALANRGNIETRMTYVVVNGVNNQYTELWIDRWKADMLEIWRAHNWVNEFDFRQKGQEKINTCGRPFNGPLQIQVDGNVIPCCFDQNNSIVLGNLYVSKLKEIFNSDVYNRLSGCHNFGKFVGSGFICEKCDQRNKDKTEALIYSSKFEDKKDRVDRTSTFHDKVIN